MNTLSQIIELAVSKNKRVVLPEGNDPRVIEAGTIIVDRGIARPTLLGDRDEIESIAKNSAINPDGLEIVDPSDPHQQINLAPTLHDARKHKGVSEADALSMIADPLLMGASMVRAGLADGMVAGATHTTAEVVRSALQLVGKKPGSKIVSSFFLMQHDLPHQAFRGTALYADCAMVIEPNAEELACIAIDSADSAINLASIEPKVALLSFSTAGSAEHANVSRVRQAGTIVAESHPDIALMTEVQFDAAILPEILEKKAPDISVGAPANVFIFPDLQSGNIGYKIAQRIGGVQAIGPILQGLNKPINDLSRGCSVDDIVNLVAVTAVQASV
jgi:phosphate acetyltransferase